MELNKEQRGQYVKKVTVMAASLGFKVSGVHHERVEHDYS